MAETGFRRLLLFQVLWSTGQLGAHNAVSIQNTIWWRNIFFGLTHSHTVTLLTPLGNKPFENTVGKGEIAQRAISPFPTVFSTHLDNFLPFSSNLKLSSANSFSLEESKICRLVMG